MTWISWRADDLNQALAWRREAARRWRGFVVQCLVLAAVTGLAIASLLAVRAPWWAMPLPAASLSATTYLAGRALGHRRWLLDQIREIERFAALPLHARASLSYVRALSEGQRPPITVVFGFRRIA